MTTSSPGLIRARLANRRPPVTPAVTITSSNCTPFFLRWCAIFSLNSGMPWVGVYLLNPLRIHSIPSSFRDREYRSLALQCSD